MNRILIALVSAAALAGCMGPKEGMVVYDDETTRCEVTENHYVSAFAGRYVVVACTDKPTGKVVCSYNMGIDENGNPNGTFYNCRSPKPQGAT